MVECCKLSLYANVLWWVRISGIEAMNTRVQPGTGDVFPVVVNTRIKSIQKQIKRIFILDKVGNKKLLESKFCFV